MNIQELQTERLDINNKYNVELVCKQLDDVILKIIVYDKSLPADLSNYNVRLKAFKADQVPLIQDANITITDNVVTIKASKQLTTTSGIVKAELQFINKTTLEKKSTFYLEIEVVASVLIDKNIVSTPTCTLLEELDNKLDEIENIGNVLEEAKVVRDTLKNTTIPIGTTLKSDLDTNITTGTQLKTDLTELIPKVEKSKSDLDASKTNADLSNKTLIETTNNAEIKKQEVVEECKVADEKIKKMNEFGDVSEISKDINLIKTEITTARDNETDLNTRLEEDKTNILSQFNDLDLKMLSIENKELWETIRNIKGKKIKIIGDSLTSGVGGTNYALDGELIYTDSKGEYKSNSKGVCWANLLKKLLENKYGCTVKNFGVGGTDTSDVVAHLSDLINDEDDIIISANGANNCYKSDGLVRLREDIKTINNYVISRGKKIINIGTIQTLTNKTEDKGIKMEDVDCVLREVTTDLKTPFIPMYKLFNDFILTLKYDYGQLYYDEWHPNDDGYRVMFYIIANQLGIYTDLEIRKKINEIYDTGWIDIPLNDGIVAHEQPQYRRMGNMVFLRGRIKGTISNSKVLFVLPYGFRPVFVEHCYSSVISNLASGNIYIETNGSVSFMSNTDCSNSILSIDTCFINY